MYKLIYTSFSFILLTVLVAGCSHTADRRLVLADTLMWTAPDSSLAILSHINSDSLTSKEDLAYHALLLTQAQFRCNGNCSSDSLINFALDYYSDNHNREHYTMPTQPTTEIWHSSTSGWDYCISTTMPAIIST